MIKRLVIFVAALFAGGCLGNNIITLPYITNDIQYSKVRDKLYAIVDAIDPEFGNQLIEINVLTGVAERSQFVGSQPALMRLTTDENYAWISFRGTPYIKRVDLNSFVVDKEVYLGPSKLYNSPNHVITTVYAYNFTLLPDQDNQMVMGLKTPFEFEFEAVSLYKNDTIQLKRMGDIFDATDTSTLKPLGNCKNDIIGDKYGFAFSDTLPITHAKMPLYLINDGWGSGFEYSPIHNCYIYAHGNTDNLYLSFFHGDHFTYVGSLALGVLCDAVHDLDVVDVNHFIVVAYNIWEKSNSIYFYHNTTKSRMFLKARTSKSWP